MLLQFSIENFRSIKNKAVLSMEASSDAEHPNNCVEAGKEKLLKTAVIFGANASGKSNMFRALTAAILLIRGSQNRQTGEKLSLIEPFAFDIDCTAKPTVFEFVFYAKQTKYVYSFSATTEKIVTERLYAYETARPTTIFERDETAEEKYRFTIPKLRTQLKPIVARNTENKLFLATAVAWNCEELRPVLDWFMKGINTYPTDKYILLNQAAPMFEADTDQTLRKFTNNILREADINISDFELKTEEAAFQPFGFRIASQGGEEIKPKNYHFYTRHDGVCGSCKMELTNESDGTIKLFGISPVLKDAFETGKTICVDELDTSLHPMLVHYIIGLFNNPEVNKKNAQLIASTHTTSLLNLKELRRDQIYFIEKNNSTAESELYSLDEYSPRKTEDIRKAYILGRFGAIPNLGDGDGIWQ